MCATASELTSKDIKSCYLGVFQDFQSSKAIKYPQFHNKCQVFDVLLIASGQICDVRQ